MRKLSTYHVVKTAVIMEAAGCFWFSYSHIQKVVESVGFSGAFAYVFPLMLDLLALLGFIGRTSDDFDATAKRAGTVIMVSVGAVSLVCNVLAGENLGQRLFGVATVGLFVAAEWYGSKLHKAPVVEVVEEAHPLKGRVCAPGCKCKRHKRNRTVKRATKVTTAPLKLVAP